MPAEPLPEDTVAKWAAPGSSMFGSEVVPYECGPEVDPEASQEEAVVAQNGPVLSAISGICLLIAMYEPSTKLGCIIHLNREFDIWEEQEQLIRDVFTNFPRLCDVQRIGFVSSQAVIDEYPKQLAQAKELCASFAPRAELKDILVGSPDHPEADPEMVAEEFDMSVELYLQTRQGMLFVQDDFGMKQKIDLNTWQPLDA